MNHNNPGQHQIRMRDVQEERPSFSMGRLQVYNDDDEITNPDVKVGYPFMRCVTWS